MEDNILINILERYGDQIINDYRRLMNQGGSVASGLLGNSLTTQVNAEDGIYEVTLRIQDYWKYVEYGRLPGTFPNVDALKKWIQIKPIIPTPDRSGHIPSLDSLAYLIGRKIERLGIEPKYYLNNTLDALDLTLLEETITNSLASRFTNTLKEV